MKIGLHFGFLKFRNQIIREGTLFGLVKPLAVLVPTQFLAEKAFPYFCSFFLFACYLI